MSYRPRRFRRDSEENLARRELGASPRRNAFLLRLLPLAVVLAAAWLLLR